MEGRSLALQVSLLRWGLIPNWAADAGSGSVLVNARAETAASKPSFREPLQRRRCLIPADGFYEWQRSERSKQPFCFEVREGELFAFAGLWDRYRRMDGGVVVSCTILTTTPNELLADVHDRMPVILPRDDYERWLDLRMQDVDKAVRLLKPFESKLMRRYPVSTRINQVGNDDEECSRPVELVETQDHLFM